MYGQPLSATETLNWLTSALHAYTNLHSQTNTLVIACLIYSAASSSNNLTNILLLTSENRTILETMG